MKVRKTTRREDFFGVPREALTRFGVHPIGCVDWPERFPSKPDAAFAIAHTGDAILLRFFVDEDYTAALVAEDNGPVWTDSCVEFFISFDETGYYNFECTCIGKALLGFRKRRNESVHADRAVLDTIRRAPSLGTEPFEERRGVSWELSAEIPVGAFFRHSLGDLSGVAARGNFYKCGDGLTVPHFLSWLRVGVPEPDFHREEFFGEIEFERDVRLG